MDNSYFLKYIYFKKKMIQANDFTPLLQEVRKMEMFTNNN